MRPVDIYFPAVSDSTAVSDVKSWRIPAETLAENACVRALKCMEVLRGGGQDGELGPRLLTHLCFPNHSGVWRARRCQLENSRGFFFFFFLRMRRGARQQQTTQPILRGRFEACASGLSQRNHALASVSTDFYGTRGGSLAVSCFCGNAFTQGFFFLRLKWQFEAMTTAIS